MTIFAHAGFSLFCGKILCKKKFDSSQKKWPLLFIFAGILPDLPLTIVTITGNFTSDIHHHEWITHAPLFWIVFSGLLAIVSKEIALTILIGTLGHLATDWYGGGDGIMFFWPFSSHQYGVLLSGHHGKEAFLRYFSHPLFLGMEIILIAYLGFTIWKFTEKQIRT